MLNRLRFSGGAFTFTGQSSVTLSSILGSYLDLKIVFNGTGSSTVNVLTQLNGDTTSDYAQQDWETNGTSGNGSNAYAGHSSIDHAMLVSLLTSSMNMYIPFYSTSSTVHTLFSKAVLFASFSSAGSNFSEDTSAGWNPASAAAITSITFTPASGTFSGSLAIYGEN
jgi:hypothetical protein